MNTQNIKNRITITSSQELILSYKTKEPTDSVKIINNWNTLCTLGDVFELHIFPNKDKIFLYGNITALTVQSDNNLCRGIDVGCDSLIHLNCSSCKLDYLHITTASNLRRVLCYDNCLSQYAIDTLFKQLPKREIEEDCRIYLTNGDAQSNFGVAGCDITIANERGWNVMDYCGTNANAQRIINASIIKTMGAIDETNYHLNSTAQFDVVEDIEEINNILSSEPKHISYRYGRKFWENEYDFDQVLYFGEEYDDEELTPDDEAREVGAIGYAYTLGHEDEYSVDNPNILLYPATNDYYVHVIERGTFGRILCQAMGKEVQSKTWVHNGYVYRYAKFWGKLRQCYWTLNLDDYTDGNQDDFILAKCKLEDFKWNSNI